MAVSKEEILETISNMTVMEIVDLISAMEEKFGVSAAAAAVAAPAQGGGGEEAAQEEEQTEFDVIMSDFGENKVGVIKTIRQITGLGLKEAKEMVENVPATIKEQIEKEDAESFKSQLEEAGAKVELK